MCIRDRYWADAGLADCGTIFMRRQIEVHSQTAPKAPGNYDFPVTYLIPVSYTHLDVYKRQLQNVEGRPINENYRTSRWHEGGNNNRECEGDCEGEKIYT